MTLFPDPRFPKGRVEIIEQIGEGGMGSVWKARDLKLGRVVALKFMASRLRFNSEAAAQLEDEAVKLAALEHPNIVRIYEMLEDDNQVALCMEFVSGQSLSGLKMRQEGRCFDHLQLTPWVRQLCEALHHAHSLDIPVIHRDIKPANLLIDDKDQLKLVDFGLSRSLSDTQASGAFIPKSGGTEGFLSPQQMKGLRPSVADDIYSIGATLYDLLAGSPPFINGDVHWQTVNEPPVMIQQRRADADIKGKPPLPVQWQDTITACLEKLPAQRPASMLEVLEKLGLMPGATVKKATRIWRKPVNKAILICVALIVLVGVGASLLPLVKSKSSGADMRMAQPYTNTLGMRFVRVPGTNVLMCMHETRRQDFENFESAMQKAGRSLTSANWRQPKWKDVTVKNEAADPVLSVTYSDASLFCEWLTQMEGRTYRLPTDKEWEAAACYGMPGAVPEQPPQYPWGKNMKLPNPFANYADESFHKWALGHPSLIRTSYFPSYQDNCSTLISALDASTQLPGAQNILGIHHVFGNAAEWIADTSSESQLHHVRGGSWTSSKIEQLMLSLSEPHEGLSTDASIGFRCVIEMPLKQP